MFCARCNNRFPNDCTCEDRDARLESIGQSSHVVLTYCSGCGEHVGLCKCADGPKPELRYQGRIVRDPR